MNKLNLSVKMIYRYSAAERANFSLPRVLGVLAKCVLVCVGGGGWGGGLEGFNKALIYCIHVIVH